MTGESHPLVSVILPTHNRAAQLPRAIRSVLAQTYPNLELIVVDDASTDATPDVVGGFQDPRLRYLRLPHNRRAAAARNVGIREARGALISFLDDDDWWLTQKLERQVPALLLATQDIGLNLCSHTSLEANRTKHVGGAEAYGRMDFAEGFNWNFGLIATPAWLVRRECLERAGLFDEGLRCWDDWELALRLGDICRFSHLDEPLFVQDRRREPGTGMWDNARWFANDMQIIMDKHSARWASRPDVLSRHYWIIARSRLEFGSAAESRPWFGRALGANPRNIKALVMLAITSLGEWGGVAARAALRGAARINKFRRPQPGRAR